LMSASAATTVGITTTIDGRILSRNAVTFTDPGPSVITVPTDCEPIAEPEAESDPEPDPEPEKAPRPYEAPTDVFVADEVDETVEGGEAEEEEGDVVEEEAVVDLAAAEGDLPMTGGNEWMLYALPGLLLISAGLILRRRLLG
ncbi:MAG: LPXTG cell wall anchor domain-containing protein, partial [Thermaerobacterales bacterium]